MHNIGSTTKEKAWTYCVASGTDLAWLSENDPRKCDTQGRIAWLRRYYLTGAAQAIATRPDDVAKRFGLTFHAADNCFTMGDEYELLVGLVTLANADATLQFCIVRDEGESTLARWRGKVAAGKDAIALAKE